MGMFKAAQGMVSDAIAKAREDAQGLSTPPVAEFHPASKELQPRVSGSMLPTKEGSAGGAFTFENIGPEGKRETSRLKVGDLLPHQLSFKTEGYASPLSGDVGEVVAIGPNYADFEFVVPKTEQHPTGLLKVRYPLRTGRKTGESPEEILQRKREEAAAEEALSKSTGYWGEPEVQSDWLGKPQRQPFDSFKTLSFDALAVEGRSLLLQGDALGYAAEHGPYHGQDLSDKEIFEASGEDLQNSQTYDIVETREVNGLNVVTFDDRTTFVQTKDGTVNVTGHPAYDPFVEE